MGQVRPAPPAKLFIAMLIASDGLDKLDAFDNRLIETFGPIDIISPAWPFGFTDFYTAEMGPNLTRRIVSFQALFDPASLGDVKHQTNDLEEELARRFRTPSLGRIVNLDAGYLTLGQIVLATTKSYSHRVYLHGGIWAEVTMRYVKGRYEKWDWTYPDYANGRYNEFWDRMRSKLKTQMAK